MTGTALRVVRAARAAFAEHGYGGASMRTIAADVGVTAMALYNYAPSKAALLQLVFDETTTEVYGSLSEAVAGQESLVGEVHAILERSGEILRDEPGHLSFRLHGRKLAGGFALTSTGPRRWILIKRQDEAARPGSDITAERPESVRSGRTWQDLAR